MNSRGIESDHLQLDTMPQSLDVTTNLKNRREIFSVVIMVLSFPRKVENKLNQISESVSY